MGNCKPSQFCAGGDREKEYLSEEIDKAVVIQSHFRGIKARKTVKDLKETSLHKPNADYAIPINANSIPKNGKVLEILDKIGNYKYTKIPEFEEIPVFGYFFITKIKF